MNTIIIKQEQYEALLSKIEAIQNSLDNANKKSENHILDTQDLIQLLHISKRTAQSWRDQGKISYSQVGSKMYYQMADVQKLLDSNYRKAFNPAKRRNY